MASFVVMEPPRGDAQKDAVLVRDGFHVLAFLAPFLWLFWYRCWLEGIVVIAISLVIGSLATWSDWGAASPALSLLVSLYVGLEGASLRLAALRRRGWREWGVVEADDRADAEMRYFSENAPHMQTDDQPWGETTPVTRPAAAPARRSDASSLGLLGFGERR